MKILTIDFDIIMAPSIDYYNHRVPTLSWEDMAKESLTNFFQADLGLYTMLTTWLFAQMDHLDKDQIHFINSHEKLLDFIPEGEHCSIINIDHHHDMGYKSNETTLTCANWVKVLAEKNILDSYCWLHNPNSIKVKDSKTDCSFPCQEDDIRSKYVLDNFKYDKLVICFSKPWIPPNYQFLFYLWHDMFCHRYQTNFPIE